MTNETNMTQARKHVKDVRSLFQQCDDENVRNTHYAQECVNVWLNEMPH